MVRECSHTQEPAPYNFVCVIYKYRGSYSVIHSTVGAGAGGDQRRLFGVFVFS